MQHMQEITSFQNNKIKLAGKLLRKREREKSERFIIDYARDLERALACDYQIDYALYCEDLASADDHAVLETIDSNAVFSVSVDLMKKASYRENPGGIVAIMHQKPMQTTFAMADNQRPHVLALVNLKKPGNIGALLRTADATGFNTVCLVDSSLDIYNPNIIRASTGAVFLDNIVSISTSDAIEVFQNSGLSIVAAHLHGTIELDKYDFATRRSVIVLGAEDTGLEDIWVNHCDALVKIPMIGQVTDSLNVSVSGAIFMYEALRQMRSNSS